MTAKSRRRKRAHRVEDKATKNYRFATATRDVIIPASSLSEAKIIFQEKFGYWPDKELNDGITDHSTEADAS